FCSTAEIRGIHRSPTSKRGLSDGRVRHKCTAGNSCCHPWFSGWPVWWPPWVKLTDLRHLIRLHRDSSAALQRAPAAAGRFSGAVTTGGNPTRFSAGGCVRAQKAVGAPDGARRLSKVVRMSDEPPPQPKLQVQIDEDI